MRKNLRPDVRRSIWPCHTLRSGMACRRLRGYSRPGLGAAIPSGHDGSKLSCPAARMTTFRHARAAWADPMSRQELCQNSSRGFWHTWLAQPGSDTLGTAGFIQAQCICCSEPLWRHAGAAVAGMAVRHERPVLGCLLVLLRLAKRQDPLLRPAIQQAGSKTLPGASSILFFWRGLTANRRRWF